ncbi:TIR domain-containing protein [Psychroflexus lacisalsi]|uniref:Thoeris protein ThsB TIR-like domain-containing protein n=1 Tax=Psychroflexus lacisalsi TaxID=503928 RepID=A0ABP3VDT8_9FLAO|nr:TIR domain-containing protein [Psychroflexus lacisalsi]MBZ9620829.1 TIR domain-containing protein [Psychroflexus lacisalsi]
MATTQNLFISHSWQYSDAYDKLCNLLDNRSYFDYKNFSVPKDDPIHTNGTDKQLLEAITNKMRLSHVILIMAGKYSTYSKWINKEIIVGNEGFTNPKPIIGIKPWRSTVVSSVVRDNAAEMVNWNTHSIVEAIRRHSNA